MDTLEAVFTRRSVRDFRPEAVPDALLRQVLRAAATSASGGNVQPWGFVLVRSAERLAGPYLTSLQAAIRAERFGNKSDQELRDVLNELCLQYAAELRTRQAEPGKVEEGRA